MYFSSRDKIGWPNDVSLRVVAKISWILIYTDNNLLGMVVFSFSAGRVLLISLYPYGRTGSSSKYVIMSVSSLLETRS